MSMLEYRPATMSSEEATKIVDELYVHQLDLGQRLIGNGRFLTRMKAGTLSPEALRVFWLNWSSFVAEVNNIIQSAYQRHIGFFKEHLDLLGPFADKVADELIHPKPPGHLLVVWEQGEILPWSTRRTSLRAISPCFTTLSTMTLSLAFNDSCLGGKWRRYDSGRSIGPYPPQRKGIAQCRTR